MPSAVLVSNFGGITGGLLSLDGGKLAGRLKADALFPVAGYKRCLDTQNGYGKALTSFHIQPLLAILQASLYGCLTTSMITALSLHTHG